MATALETFEHKHKEIFSLLPANLSSSLEISKESTVEELAKKADQALNKQQENPTNSSSEEALRLAWLFAQIKLRELPSSALCSTLIELTPFIEKNPPMSELAKASYSELSRILEEKWQKRLAIGVLEEAAITIKEPNFLIANLEKLDELISEELTSLENRRAPLSERKNLEEKQKEYKAKLKKLKKNQTTTGANASSIAKSSTATLTPKNLASTGETTNLNPKRSKSLLPLVFLLSAILISSLAAYSYMAIKETSAPKLELAKPSNTFQEKPSPILPGLLPVKAKATDRFNQATERLANLLKDREDSSSEATEKEPEIPLAVEEQTSKTEEKTSEYQSQEIISIDPSNPKNSEIPENNVPKLDPSTLANTTIEPVGSSGKKAPIPKEALRQGVRVQGDGRIYGRGSNSDKSRGSTTLDGSKVRSYPVRKFSPPLTYRTVAPTKVVSAPSILSHTLAELSADTPVYVSARLERWLEVVSSNGGVGYIYSQDAKQIRGTR